MNHPFGPLMLAGLISAETANELRAREQRHAYLESQRATHHSLAERLRSVARPSVTARADLADCACPA